MPLWRIFVHPDIFTPSQRAALAKDVTNLYVSRGLPAFYVNVLFIPLEQDNYFIGGAAKKNFVRIVAEQIARQMPDPSTEDGRKSREQWMDMINQTLKPHITDRPELEWEFHIAETPFDLWRVQGLSAPPPQSEAETRWLKENKATPWKL